MVIIFVSREYKNSFNCKAEANYARGLVKKGRLKMIFVMMQADYTTHSEPEFCDGWLGLYIGQDMYYEFYDLSGVTKVVDKIAKVLSDKTLHDPSSKSPVSLPPISQLSNQVGLDGVSSPIRTPRFTTPRGSPQGTLSVDAAARASINNFNAVSSTKHKPLEHSPSQQNLFGDINKAWSVIKDPNKIVKARREEILVYLDDVGMTCAEDLDVHADDADALKKIEAFLNQTGQKYWEKVFPAVSSSNPKPIEHSPSQQNLIGDINKAWSVIMDPTKIVKDRREAIVEYLDEIGMSCAEDLEAHADDADTLNAIKAFLNPTGQKYWGKIFPVKPL